MRLKNLINRINIRTCILYIFSLFMILNCNSVYSSSKENLVCQALLLIIFTIALRDISKIPNLNVIRIVMFIIIFSLSVIVFLYFNYLQSPFSISYYLLLFIIDPIMLIIYFVSQIKRSANRIFYIFENVVLFLSIISLIFWVLVSVGIPTTSTKVISWGGTRAIPGYFGLAFFAQGSSKFLGIFNMIRNTGIFNESPMYSYVLCIALIVELYFKGHSTKWKIIVLFITILSTGSTTGLFIAVPAVLFKMFMSSDNMLFKSVIILCIPLLLIGAKFALNSKIGDVRDESSSYNMRKNDIISCIYAWKQHLLIGNGLNDTSAISQYGYTVYVNGLPTQSTGGSNGIFMVLAHGGIVESLFYIIPTLLFSMRSFRALLISVFTFILLIYTLISNSFICIMLISYFWAYSLFNLNLFSNNEYSLNINGN